MATIAALPVHKEKARLWQKLNDRESVRPMVWINEVCWHEMNVNDELTLSAEHPWAREQEQELRRTLYQWRHLPVDMIVNDYLVCPLAIHSTDFGIMEDVDVVKTDEANEIVSRHFNVQIQDYADLDKIQMPVVTHNREATEISLPDHVRGLWRHPAYKEAGPNAHLVHPLGLPDPLVGHRAGHD